MVPRTHLCLMGGRRQGRRDVAESRAALATGRTPFVARLGLVQAPQLALHLGEELGHRWTRNDIGSSLGALPHRRPVGEQRIHEQSRAQRLTSSPAGALSSPANSAAKPSSSALPHVLPINSSLSNPAGTNTLNASSSSAMLAETYTTMARGR